VNVVVASEPVEAATQKTAMLALGAKALFPISYQVADEALAYTKRFSGKATAPILASNEGSDEGVHYQLKDLELAVKAKKTMMVKWELEGGWRVRWKLVCGAFDISYSAYFVAKPPLKPEQTPDEVGAAFAELKPLFEQVLSCDQLLGILLVRCGLMRDMFSCITDGDRHLR
jgi:hypothetical protein